MSRLAPFRAAVCLCALGATSCFSLSFERDLAHEPTSGADVSALEPGRSTLGDALARLGAPLYVWSGAAGRTCLAYGAQRDRDFGLRFTLPIGRVNPSLTVNDQVSKLRGYVLVFDADWKLVIARPGLLHDLGVDARRRSDPVEEP